MNTIKLSEEITSTPSLLWHAAMDDATFARTAASFANPDQVAIVIHIYR
jgi:hypothetical protein